MRKVIFKIRHAFEKRKKSINENSNKGFTLVELLVAIVILSLVIVPTLSVFVTATKANSKARVELQATITADSVLESAKSFSLYVYSVQCNKAYSSTNYDDFTLIAGSTTKSLMELGGTCGQISFDESDASKCIVQAPTKGNTFEPGQDRYAFAINGIKQSNSTYDALVVFEKAEYQAVSIDGSSYTESDVQSEYGSYNKEYAITVYVYKHEDTPAYVGKDLNGKMGALETITGSKMDSAKTPTE